jgi:hypothetical protein
VGRQQQGMLAGCGIQGPPGVLAQLLLEPPRPEDPEPDLAASQSDGLTNRRMRARMSGGVGGDGATPSPTRSVILAGSTLERRKDGRSRASSARRGVTAPNWQRTVPGGTQGRQPAVRPQGAKAELPAQSQWVSRGCNAPARRVRRQILSPPSPYLAQINASSARGAPRVRFVGTTPLYAMSPVRVTGCRRPSGWSTGPPMTRCWHCCGPVVRPGTASS